MAMQSSIQLWSLRLSIDEHGWGRAIDSVADAGFRNVEPFALDRTADVIGPGIAANSLAVPTAHGLLDSDVLEATLSSAAALGVRTVYHPHLDESHWKSHSAIAATADMLNLAAEAARDYGILIGFHNHDFELRHHIDGESAFTQLLQQIGDDVQVEFDVNWAAIARTDPESIASQLAGRLCAVHVKDGPLEGTNPQQRALGDGELGLDGFVSALPEDAVLVLSLDQFEGSSADVEQAIVTSRSWLESRGIS